jgi:RND family efflux transporter MFP subunit
VAALTLLGAWPVYAMARRLAVDRLPDLTDSDAPVSVGSGLRVVTRSSYLRGLVLVVVDPSSLELEADLPEGIASHVRQGDELAVRVDGVVGDITGTVREIAPAADPVTRTIRIKLELPLEEGLRSGQFARLQVPTGEGESLSVPASAVVRRGQMEIVFVVVNRRAELRLVKTGGVNGESVEILAGLEAGETVVIEGAGQLADGQPVEVK